MKQQLPTLAEINNDLVRLIYLDHLSRNPRRRGGLTQRDFTARWLFDASARRAALRETILDGLELVDDHRAPFDVDAVGRLIRSLYDVEEVVGCPFRFTVERETDSDGVVFRVNRDWNVDPSERNCDLLNEMILVWLRA